MKLVHVLEEVKGNFRHSDHVINSFLVVCLRSDSRIIVEEHDLQTLVGEIFVRSRIEGDFVRFGVLEFGIRSDAVM